ncbi:hypothetical protein ABEB36_007208 [Hypothenemus hampei]|uniref:Uncharacterized protein n=1 Tax=Hypothenemus hampei TaxID=57062 RepID=A0ABD1ET65_HYPHA
MTKLYENMTLIYFRDKNVSKVSGIWKALHLSIYIAISVNAFVGSMATGNMLQTFKYNCILFCHDIQFEQEVLSDTNSTLMENNILNPENDTDLYFNNTKKLTEYMGKKNKTILFKSETVIIEYEAGSVITIEAKIDMRKTSFPSNFWCNFLLAVQLVTFIFATFCTVLMAMCSKGGKGQNNTLNRPQNIVYPIIVSSILLILLNFIATVQMNNGTSTFCSNFQQFTGETSCSPLLNRFTLHERQKNFYLPYMVLTYSLNITIILFVCQLVVTTSRVLYAVDFQLYALDIDEDDKSDD